MGKQPQMQCPTNCAERPHQETTKVEEMAVVERSLDWLPKFDDARVTGRVHYISVLRCAKS